MQKKMKIILSLILILITLENIQAKQILVTAEKNGKIIYILPEAHVFVEKQEGALTEKSIIPKLNKIGFVLKERARFGTETRTPFGLSECAKNNDFANKKIINQIIRSNVKKSASGIWLTGGDMFINEYSSFSKLMALMFGGPSLKIKKQNKVIDYVEKSDVEIVSIETVYDFYRAYCETPDQEKEEIFKYMINQSKRINKLKYKNKFDAFYLDIIEDIKERLEHNHNNNKKIIFNKKYSYHDSKSFKLEDNAFNRFLFSKRNIIWMDTLQNNLIYHDQVFFIVGAGHLLDIGNGKGLISLLQDDGFEVSYEEG